MEIDFEDFVEEVKFQMTEYDILKEEIILNWERKVRKWLLIKGNKRKGIKVNAPDDIYLKIKDEEIMKEVARKFYQAVKNNREEEYWTNFQLIC